MLFLEGIPYPKSDTSPDIVAWPAAEFDLTYEDAWLDHPWSRKVISDIQRFDVTDLSKSVTDLLLDQGMRPEDLATGTKNLLLNKFAYDGRKFRIAYMGENCYKWLMDIADEKDICGVMTASVFFTDEDLQGRPVYIVNNRKTVTTAKDFGMAMIDLKIMGVYDYDR